MTTFEIFKVKKDAYIDDMPFVWPKPSVSVLSIEHAARPPYTEFMEYLYKRGRPGDEWKEIFQDDLYFLEETRNLIIPEGYKYVGTIVW